LLLELESLVPWYLLHWWTLVASPLASVRWMLVEAGLHLVAQGVALLLVESLLALVSKQYLKSIEQWVVLVLARLLQRVAWVAVELVSLPPNEQLEPPC
jgi:hypothetical protein